MNDQGMSRLAKGPIMEYVLGKLFGQCQEIDAAIIATYSGLLLAANARERHDPESIGAVASLILGNSMRMIREFRQGRLTELFVLGTEGYTLLVNVGEVGFLTVTSPSDKIQRSTYHSVLKAAKSVEVMKDWLV